MLCLHALAPASHLQQAPTWKKTGRQNHAVNVGMYATKVAKQMEAVQEEAAEGQVVTAMANVAGAGAVLVAIVEMVAALGMHREDEELQMATK